VQTFKLPVQVALERLPQHRHLLLDLAAGGRHLLELLVGELVRELGMTLGELPDGG
jgi:hypothetical protein